MGDVLEIPLDMEKVDRQAAVSKITDKMDQNKAAQAQQYQAIMNQLLEMQRDINRSNP